MKTLFTTQCVHPRDRFDLWHSVACKEIVLHESRPLCRDTFVAELHTASIADIALVRFANAPMVAGHDACHVGRSDHAHLFLCRQNAGRLVLEQDGRQCEIDAGDFALVDPAAPYTADFRGLSDLLVLKLPRRPLEARLGATRALCARPMRATDPEAGLTSSMLALLPQYADRLGQDAASALRQQVLDLVALAFARTLERLPRLSSPRALVLARLHAAIEARLDDPSVDGPEIAAMAGVSVRYANAVLAAERLSLTRLILARRLERCRQALEDPAQSNRRLSEIAYGWGFSDMTHFGRAFRAAYGVLPRDYRRSRLPRQ